MHLRREWLGGKEHGLPPLSWRYDCHQQCDRGCVLRRPSPHSVATLQRTLLCQRAIRPQLQLGLGL